jgi:hypothetical protein
MRTIVSALTRSFVVPVQSLFFNQIGVPVPRNSGALLCGQKGMAEAVTEILTKAGVFEGRVLTNF